MSATLVNSFPPVHSYDSPRSCVLALIALLHIGFFWALSAGLIVNIVPDKPHVTELVPVENHIDPDPNPKPPAEPAHERIGIFAPDLDDEIVYRPVEDLSRTPIDTTGESEPAASEGRAGSAEPIVEEPSIDSRYLTEPVYPSSEIRGEHEGTVVLAIQVLGNGRVGEVRVEHSSGREKLDQSAAREARNWRFKPGMRDGIPVTMWKSIPVTFQLKDRSR